MLLNRVARRRIAPVPSEENPVCRTRPDPEISASGADTNVLPPRRFERNLTMLSTTSQVLDQSFGLCRFTKGCTARKPAPAVCAVRTRGWCRASHSPAHGRGQGSSGSQERTPRASNVLRRVALVLGGAQLAALSHKLVTGPPERAFGDGGGSVGCGDLSYSGDGGANFGALPAYARNEDDDLLDEDDDELRDYDELDDEESYEEEFDADSEDISTGSRPSKKPRNKDSFICESVLATNLPTGPGIPTKVRD